MNCKNCNSLIEPQGHFCPQCGTPAKENITLNESDHGTQEAPMWPRPIEAEATLITSQQSLPLVLNPHALSQQPQQMEQAPLPQPSNNSFQSGSPSLYSQQQASPYPPQNQPSSFTETAPPLSAHNLQQISPRSPISTATPDLQRQQGRRTPQRSLSGCLLRLMTVLVLLLATLVAAWYLALRPNLHNITQNELDKAMTRAVEHIPPTLSQLLLLPHPQLPPIPIKESTLQTLIILNIAPSDPVQNPVVHINQQGVRLEFTIHQQFLSSDFNFPCAISLLPVLDTQGNIVARNVSVEGIASLVMSNDEMTSLINQHFSDAMKRLNHPIADLQLKQGELDITLN